MGGIPEAWQRKLNNQARSNLLIDFAYFAFLIVLIILLVFAFAFAQYLRRREQEEMEAAAADSQRLNSDDDDVSPNGTVACTCSNQLTSTNSEWALTSFSNKNYFNDGNTSFSNQHQLRDSSSNNLVDDTRGLHLSEARMAPIYADARNPYGGHKRLSRTACCANPLLSAPNFAGSERALASGRHELAQALIHKGFYEKTANLSRTRSCSRQLNEADREAAETHLDRSEQCTGSRQSGSGDDVASDDADVDNEDEDEIGDEVGDEVEDEDYDDDYDDDYDEVDRKSAFSDQWPALGKNLARSGSRSGHNDGHRHNHRRRLQLTQSSLGSAAIYIPDNKCRCSLASLRPLSANPSKAVSMLRSSYDSQASMNNCCQYLRRQIINSSPRTATLNSLNLTSAYAIRSKPAKIRAKGSSSGE